MAMNGEITDALSVTGLHQAGGAARLALSCRRRRRRLLPQVSACDHFPPCRTRQSAAFWISGSRPRNWTRPRSTAAWSAGSAPIPQSTSASARNSATSSTQALQGKLDHWAATTEGRLALILLLDQFCRNIHRGTAKAFAGDKRALKLCVEGSMNNDYRTLSPDTAGVLLHAAAARRIAGRAGQVGAHLQRAGRGRLRHADAKRS